MALLEVRDLNVWFDLPRGGRLHAVRGVSFDLEAGERMGLVGESGCGKSTTILALMSLLPPSAEVSGEVRLAGRSILTPDERSAREHRWNDVSMVFQGAMNALNPVRTVVSQIVEPMEVHGTATGAAARSRAEELLEMVGIAPTAGTSYPHEFSGGMRQRALIAMALACQPKVLLADEPTTALDVMVQAQIVRLLRSLSEDLGLGLVLVTHDLPVVAQTCQRAAVMYAGEVVEEAPIEGLVHDPRHPYTRLLFESTPDLFGDSAVTSIPGVPPRLDAQLVGCSFAPRCDSTAERCLNEPPAMVVRGNGRRPKCHFNRPDEAGAAS